MVTGRFFKRREMLGTSTCSMDVGDFGMTFFHQSPTTGCISFQESQPRRISIPKFSGNTLSSCYVRDLT